MVRTSIDIFNGHVGGKRRRCCATPSQSFTTIRISDDQRQFYTEHHIVTSFLFFFLSEGHGLYFICVHMYIEFLVNARNEINSHKCLCGCCCCCCLCGKEQKYVDNYVQFFFHFITEYVIA